jgi:hypothetical protein
MFFVFLLTYFSIRSGLYYTFDNSMIFCEEMFLKSFFPFDNANVHRQVYQNINNLTFCDFSRFFQFHWVAFMSIGDD